MMVALRKESVDRNSRGMSTISYITASLSARRAWIEIPAGCWRDSRRAVALRKESVDRNTSPHSINSMTHVALRKESVDRNFGAVQIIVVKMVALRKESVDRNCAECLRL